MRWAGFSGVRQPASNALSITRSDDSDTRPEAGREEQDALFGPQGAGAQPLVAPLDIAGAVQHVAQIEQELCDDYPELSFDKLRLSGTVSGQALRIARQPVVVKVNQRRASYDGALVRAMQMALAIGGWREYEGYQGLSLESYDKGDLDFTIGDRPVFAVDPLDELAEEQALWMAAEQAVKAGLPLRVFLKRQEWTDEDLQELDESPETQARLAQMEMAVQSVQTMKAVDQG